MWLVNTGWTGGPYGVGTRMKIAYTRAMIRAALSGALDTSTYEKDARLQPRHPDELSRTCPPDVLNPRSTWANAADYDAQADQARAHVRRQLQDLRHATASSAEVTRRRTRAQCQ